MRRFANVFNAPPSLPDAFGIGPTYDWSASIDGTSPPTTEPEDRMPSLEHSHSAILAGPGNSTAQSLLNSPPSLNSHPYSRPVSVLHPPRPVQTPMAFQNYPGTPAEALRTPLTNPLFDWSTVPSPTPSFSDFSIVVSKPPPSFVDGSGLKRQCPTPLCTNLPDACYPASTINTFAPAQVTSSPSSSVNPQNGLALSTANVPNIPMLTSDSGTHLAPAVCATLRNNTHTPAIRDSLSPSLRRMPIATPDPVVAPIPRPVASIGLLNYTGLDTSATATPASTDFGIFGPPSGLLESAIHSGPTGAHNHLPRTELTSMAAPVTTFHPVPTLPAIQTPHATPNLATLTGLTSRASTSPLPLTSVHTDSPTLPPAPKPAYTLAYAPAPLHDLVPGPRPTSVAIHPTLHAPVHLPGPNYAPTPVSASPLVPGLVPRPARSVGSVSPLDPRHMSTPVASTPTAHVPTPVMEHCAPVTTLESNAPPVKRPLFRENSGSAGSPATMNDLKKRKELPGNKTPGSRRRRTEAGVITIQDSDSDSSDLDAEIARTYGFELKDTGFQDSTVPSTNNSNNTKSLREKKKGYPGTKWTGGPGGPLKFNAKPEGFVEGVDRWSYSEDPPKSALVTERLEGDVHFCPVVNQLPEEEPFKCWVCVSGPQGLLRWVEFEAGQPHPRYKGFVFKRPQLSRVSPRWVRESSYKSTHGHLGKE